MGKKRAVGIHLRPEVVDYFKGLAEETGLPYQKLIDLYPSRLREEAQEADDEVGGVARVAYPLQKPCLVPRHAILHLATLPRLSTVPQNHLNPEGSF